MTMKYEEAEAQVRAFSADRKAPDPRILAILAGDLYAVCRDFAGQDLVLVQKLTAFVYAECPADRVGTWQKVRAWLSGGDTSFTCPFCQSNIRCDRRIRKEVLMEHLNSDCKGDPT